MAGIAPRPLLLVPGSQDEIVDVSHAYQLYDRAKEPKQIIIIDGAEHRLRQNDRAVAIAIDWLKSHTQISEPVDKLYVNLYSKIRFICPNFSEGVSMYTLNRLTRRGYYQKMPFLSEITHLQDCLRHEPAL